MADFSKMPGFLAVLRGSIRQVLEFVEGGGDVNEVETHSGTSMLIQAAFNGHTAIAKFLITVGANINHKDKYSQTPLMYAALAGRGAMVKLLLDSGADINAVSVNKSTALSIAHEYKKLGVVEILQYYIRQKQETEKGVDASELECLSIQPETEVKLRLIVDVVEYNDVKDFVERSVQKDHKFTLKVLSIMKILFDRKKFDVRSRSLVVPDRSVRKFYGNSLKNINSVIQKGFSPSRLVAPGTLGKFGDGIYFYSDSSSAVANCGLNQYILVCDISLGKYWTVNSGMDHLNFQEISSSGYDSLYAQRGTVESGGVEYDEFVIYDGDQAVPVYLVEFEKIASQTLPQVTPTKSTSESTTSAPRPNTSAPDVIVHSSNTTEPTQAPTQHMNLDS